MEIGEFPGRRGRESSCIDRDERAAKGDAGAMVGMLRGLRVDARCLATFPQHPSWTTAAATATAPIHAAAIDDFHDHCCRRCCASAIIQDRYLAPRRLVFSIRRDFRVYTRACVCIYICFLSRRILESDSSNQNWKLEFVCNREILEIGILKFLDIVREGKVENSRFL